MKHNHRYERIKLKDKFVMRCSKPDCTHFVHMNSKLSVPILVGKVAECNSCHEPFILDNRALRLAKPKCDDCVNTTSKVKKEVESAEDFFKELEQEIKSGS